MRLTADRATTHALVVGIERYDVGPRWNLNGPAEDAARFVTWLRRPKGRDPECGVPAANVLAFVSALDENAGTVAACEGLGVGVADATLDNIRRALAETLPSRAGSLLVIYWGGHGVVTQGFDRRLFFHDASAGDKRHLVFESLLKAALTQRYQGFRQQVVIVDACANYFEEMRSAIAIEGERIPAHQSYPNHEVHQSVMYASAAGQVAMNDTLHRTGAFSRVVLDRLNADPVFPPDFDLVSAAVTEHFAALRESGASRQRPVQYFCTVGPAPGDTGSIPAAGGTVRAAQFRNASIEQIGAIATAMHQCTSMLERVKRDALVNGLDAATRGAIPMRHDDPALDLQSILSAALMDSISLKALFDTLALIEPDQLSVRRVREASERVLIAASARTALRQVLIAESVLTRLYLLASPDWQLAPLTLDLDGKLEVLADMAPRTGSASPLVEFMERVRRQTRHAAIDEWLSNHATPQQRADIGLRLDAERAVANRPKPYLSVMVRTARLNASETPEVEAWLFTGEENRDKHWLESCDASETGARAAFSAILVEARAMAGSDVSIEFLVPREQFGLAPERWEVGEDEYTTASKLGRNHPVVLRWRERVRDPGKSRRDVWIRRTRLIEERLKSGGAATVLWVPDTHDRDALQADVTKEDSGEYIALLFVPPDLPADLRLDLLIGALVEGAPIVCWLRAEPPDWNDVKEHVTRLALLGPIDTLPRRLRELRSGTAALASLSVICDHPDHLPHPRKATTPPHRGT